MAEWLAGFFDVDELLLRLSTVDDQLESYAKAVDFELLWPELEAALAYADGSIARSRTARSCLGEWPAPTPGSQPFAHASSTCSLSRKTV